MQSFINFVNDFEILGFSVKLSYNKSLIILINLISLKKDLPMCEPHGSGLKQYSLKATRDDYMSDVNNFENIAVLKESYKVRLFFSVIAL